MKSNETSYLRWHRLEALVTSEHVIKMLAATCEDGIGVMARWTRREDGAYDVEATCTESGQWEAVVDSEEESIPMTPPTVFDDLPGDRVLTCVYCGQEYPQGTPPSGHEVLTEHIKVCEKHPMRKANDQLRISKEAISHTLRAICDDAQKFWLMGGRFSGSFSKLAEAHAELQGLDVEEVYAEFKPHDMLAYDTYCDEREADERLLTYCRENGITLPKD